jgi:hypothetical protein
MGKERRKERQVRELLIRILINVEKIRELENHHFVTITVKTE